MYFYRHSRMTESVNQYETDCRYRCLYRLLRKDESPTENGIQARKPAATTTPEDHVSSGSSKASQFISTSASWQAITNFATHSITNPKRIAIINCVNIPGVQYIDLTSKDMREKHLETEKSVNFAVKFAEVLIIGEIRPEFIVGVYTIPPYPFLYRLLREDEWTKDEMGNARPNGPVVAKDPSATVRVRDHVTSGSDSSRASQFISTSATLEAIKTFASESMTEVKMIARINCKRLRNVEYIDLTNKNVRMEQRLEYTEQAKNFAVKFAVVILKGVIPTQCVDLIELSDGNMFPVERPPQCRFCERLLHL